jgi:hypothetical protein
VPLIFYIWRCICKSCYGYVYTYVHICIHMYVHMYFVSNRMLNNNVPLMFDIWGWLEECCHKQFEGGKLVSKVKHIHMWGSFMYKRFVGMLTYAWFHLFLKCQCKYRPIPISYSKVRTRKLFCGLLLIRVARWFLF